MNKYRLNPLFDEDSKSTFAMDCDAKDVFEAGGLIFHVLDWDRGIGGDDLLGAATVPAKDLYKSNWEPTDYKILPPKGEETEDAGYITIRSRSALDDEIKQKGIGLWNRGVVPVATKKEDENVVRVSFILHLLIPLHFRLIRFLTDMFTYSYLDLS